MRWRTAGERRLPRSPASFHLAGGRFEQAAEHLDGGGFARAVRAEQSVDFAVSHLEVDVLDGGEIAEALGEMLRADGDLPAQIAVGMPAGISGRVHLCPKARSVATKVFSSVGSATRISWTCIPRSLCWIALRPWSTLRTITSSRSPNRCTSEIWLFEESSGAEPASVSLSLASASPRLSVRTSSRFMSRLARSSAGVPVWRISPRCIRATRWQRSASSR